VKSVDDQHSRSVFVVYDPTVPRRRNYAPLAERREGVLENGTVGLLWNSKPNGDVYLRHIKRLLSAASPGLRFLERVKPIASRALDEPMLADLLACGAVVNALGD
jgi:phage gp37-like protein